MLQLLKLYFPFTRYPYVGETVVCPVCSCEHGVRVASVDRRFKRLPTLACTVCGLLYTNPMPTENELHEYYTRLYRLDYQGAASKPSTRHLQKRTREAGRRLRRVRGLLKPTSRTLDFGCGTGEFLTGLRSLGHDAHGFEPGHNYGHYAQSIHGERVKVQSWQEVSYDQPFDLVSCFHVLEHLKNPVAALKKMAQWIRPDGLVYVEVPDMGSTKRNKGFGAMHFAHLTGFNHHNLLVAASVAGLEPKVVVSKTGIIFSPVTNDNHPLNKQEAEKGKQLAMSLYADKRAFYNYFRYQLGKIFCMKRRKKR